MPFWLRKEGKQRMECKYLQMQELGQPPKEIVGDMVRITSNYSKSQSDRF